MSNILGAQEVNLFTIKSVLGIKLENIGAMEIQSVPMRIFDSAMDLASNLLAIDMSDLEIHM